MNAMKMMMIMFIRNKIKSYRIKENSKKQIKKYKIFKEQ